MQIKEPVNILDVPVHPLTMQEAVSVLENSIANGEQAFVVTANAEIIMMCQHPLGSCYPSGCSLRLLCLPVVLL